MQDVGKVKITLRILCITRSPQRNVSSSDSACLIPPAINHVHTKQLQNLFKYFNKY